MDLSRAAGNSGRAGLVRFLRLRQAGAGRAAGMLLIGGAACMHPARPGYQPLRLGRLQDARCLVGGQAVTSVDLVHEFVD